MDFHVVNFLNAQAVLECTVISREDDGYVAETDDVVEEEDDNISVEEKLKVMEAKYEDLKLFIKTYLQEVYQLLCDANH